MHKKFLVLPVLLILLTSATIPYSYSSTESEAQEDIQAGCRDAQTLVYRFAYKDFVCVEPSTADRWVELGMAEIIKENSQNSTKENSKVEPTEFPGAPPPAPKHTVTYSDVDSTCRDGNILVYHFSYHDNICTSYSAANTWERLGLAEIVKNLIDEQDDMSVEITNNLLSENIVEMIELPLEEEQEILMGEEEILIDEESETVEDIIPYSDDSDTYPIIRQIGRNIWNVLDYDGSTSFFIEGNTGVIVIDSLSSYNSNQEIIDEFQKISAKKIKAVILTNINPDILLALEAYVEKSDGGVEIIISENLLQNYENISGTQVKNTIPFSNSFSVNIIGINLELFTSDMQESFQTLIYVPDNDGLIIGDSEYGMFPFLFDLEFHSQFLNE
ncbi:MAG: MBL fold metallo-hydrolase [Candidatus Nitrosopumilus sp. bin_32a]